MVRAQRRPYAGEESPAAVEATVVIAADGGSTFRRRLRCAGPADRRGVVGRHDGGNGRHLYGYYVNTFGALTDTEFSLDASGYSVVRLYNGGDLTLGLSRTIPSAALDDLVVRVGGRHFLLSDAVYVPGGNAGPPLRVQRSVAGLDGRRDDSGGAARLHHAGRADGVAGDDAGAAGGRPRLDGAGVGRRRDRGLPDGVLGRRGHDLAGAGGEHGHRGHELPRRERGTGRDAVTTGSGGSAATATPGRPRGRRRRRRLTASAASR